MTLIEVIIEGLQKRISELEAALMRIRDMKREPYIDFETATSDMVADMKFIAEEALKASTS
jgi:hypothetical protein